MEFHIHKLKVYFEKKKQAVDSHSVRIYFVNFHFGPAESITSHNGSEYFESLQELVWEEGDADPHGGSGCCWKDDYFVQAQTGRDCDDDSHDR